MSFVQAMIIEMPHKNGGCAMSQLADQFRGFRRNTQVYAAWWLVHGEVHPDEHPYITARLAEWRVEAARQRQGEALQSCAREILTEAAEQRTWEQRERLGRSSWQAVAPAEPAGVMCPAVPAGEAGGGGIVEELGACQGPRFRVQD